MRECKDCRHYRNGFLRRWPADHEGEYAACVHPIAGEFEFAEIAREDDEFLCGEDARYFEPITLGRSHGVDWGLARERAECQAWDREIANVCRLMAQLDEEKKARERAIVTRTHFTIAEYLAALTTDYDPPARVAAE